MEVSKVLAALEAAADRLGHPRSKVAPAPADLAALAVGLREVDAALKGHGGIRELATDADFRDRLATGVASLTVRLQKLECRLDAGGLDLPAGELEALNAPLVDLKDLLWTLGRDRIELGRAVEDLAHGASGLGSIAGFAAAHTVLAALDRLEVRGRDSAGLHLLVSGHGLDVASPRVRRLIEHRRDPLFAGGSVRLHGDVLSFVYKTAAEIGKLGDNGAALRADLKGDELLAMALAGEDAEVVALGHTRWASVGLINEANAHPLNEEETGRGQGPPVIAVLNGDVDNYADLKATESLYIADEITTDAKVIPVLMSRRLAAGAKPFEAFRDTVASFVGSVAIASQSPAVPESLFLAQRGSGQALYVGLAPDTFIVASEPYGVVELTSTYLRLDGETAADPENPIASRGQMVALDRRRAGQLDGLERWAYDGTPLPIGKDELQTAEITTRDVDRGEHPHYLRKEMGEAPTSFRKTLRGRIRSDGGQLRVDLPGEALPESVRDRLRAGALRRVLVIGQGTAAVAGRAIAEGIRDLVSEQRLQVDAMPATELSGFRLRDDMSDTLVIAISQSGTTTDTNRTVDLVRARGGTVISIVNRRNSDLLEKSDGVLFTSDGRDVEMSVASTKAFYSQVAAGVLLSLALADLVVPGESTGRRQDLLLALRQLPTGLEQVLGKSDQIAAIAARHAPAKRYWAVVGNGYNRIAAEEVRIKLSELCYKSIACDTTEDKKHIDLSSEPLILVCAAGLVGSTADDVAKEVAIYRAHKAVPIVIASEGASEGEQWFEAAVERITVPRLHPSLDFVLATMVGHLFGYHAARAIDALAHPLREARSAIERLLSRSGAEVADAAEILEEIRAEIDPATRAFYQRLRDGSLDGHLEASTAADLASLLRYVDGSTPLEAFASQHGKPGSPGLVVEAVAGALSRAIAELTRPIDAIKHQAKTVTVGISRSDEALLTVPLVRALLETGVDRDHVGYRDLRSLAALDPVVQRVLGFTRYRIDGDPSRDDCGARVIATGGISRDLPSRTSRQPTLRGTKHLVATERQLLAARGLADGRTFVLLPEIRGRDVVGLVLLHVQYVLRASSPKLRGVLSGYRRRYGALRDAVTETEPSFREELLETMDVADLLCEPVHVLAKRWREQNSAAGD